MNKKIIISIIVIFILILIGGGVFWLQEKRGEKKNSGSVEDFSIRYTSQGKVLENKREGLRVEVPDGWDAEKAETLSFSEWGVNLFSPDIEFDSHYLLKKGCRIKVSIEISNLHFEVANRYIQIINKREDGKRPKLEEDEFEIIKIDQHYALQDLIFDEPQLGIEIDTRIPLENDKNIYFLFASTPKNRESCLQEFDNFLKTISIER